MTRAFNHRRSISSRSLRGVAFLLAMVSAVPASAHDFWLEPGDFTTDPGVLHPVSVFIGHAQDRMAWSLAPERVIGFRTIGPEGVRDQMPFYDPAADTGLRVRTDTPGLHWLTIETQDAISELPADRFEPYVEKEGLTAIRMDRIRRRMTQDVGTERYSRRAKALVASGDWTAVNSDHITRPLGLTLEIIPRVNPLTLAAGEPIALDVRYRGQQLPGATMKIIRLDKDAPIRTVKADGVGRISVNRPQSGSWMYHVVWGTPLPEGSAQDYDTIFSSLTFAIPD